MSADLAVRPGPAGAPAHPASPTLARVARGDLCSGCGLCAALSDGAVGMAMTGPGWLRPVQRAPLTATQERAIAATCPAVLVDERHPAAIDNPLWGPLVWVGTGHATDAALRHNASSGGVISALLTDALATGQVAFVVQTGMDNANPIANRVACSTHRDDVFAAAGSRYAPSAPLADLEAHLADGRPFAFVGKPCDVTALRARERDDPRIAAQVPLKLAFFCAGVPSERAAARILDRIEAPRAHVRAFRYRGDGWPGYATATLADGTTRRMSYADSWGGILSKEVQFRCKICPDAVGGDADVACADAWYGDDRGYPSFEEADGRSLIVARTPTGRAALDAALARGSVVAEPLDALEIAKMQPSQARRKRLIASRLAAMALTGRPRPTYRGVNVAAAARGAGLLEQARSTAGLVRRILQGRA